MFRRDAQSILGRHLQLSLAPLRHRLVVIRLPLREVGVGAGRTVVVPVAIAGDFAGVFDHRERRRQRRPVALLDLAQADGGLVG